MQISPVLPQIPIASSTSAGSGEKPGSPMKIVDPLETGSGNGINFSRVTPRQLHAYLNELIFSNQIDLLEVGAFTGAVTGDEWLNQSDVPIDLRGRIQGQIEFDLDRGGSLVEWYADALKHMDLLEARSVRLSVMA